MYFENIKFIELDKGNWKQKKKELFDIQIKEYWYHKMKKNDSGECSFQVNK